MESLWLVRQEFRQQTARHLRDYWTSQYRIEETNNIQMDEQSHTILGESYYHCDHIAYQSTLSLVQ